MNNEFEELLEPKEDIKKKKINRAKKGYTKEKRIRDQLKSEGWLIAFKSIRWRFGCIDFATIFDVVALKGKERKYISSKHLGSSNFYLSHQEEIKKFKEQYGLPGESFELWLWDKPRWVGRGENKKFQDGHFKIIVL